MNNTFAEDRKNETVDCESLCRDCCTGRGDDMLTTYCMTGLHCERCGRQSDLAIVIKWEEVR